MATYPSWEPAVKREYQKGWYQDNAESVKLKVRTLKASRRNFIAGYKLAIGCVDCGYDSNHLGLDLDHETGIKVSPIATMMNYSMERILAELKKCVVRCAICHRIKTVERLRANGGKNPITERTRKKIQVAAKASWILRKELANG